MKRNNLLPVVVASLFATIPVVKPRGTDDDVVTPTNQDMADIDAGLDAAGIVDKDAKPGDQAPAAASGDQAPPADGQPKAKTGEGLDLSDALRTAAPPAVEPKTKTEELGPDGKPKVAAPPAKPQLTDEEKAAAKAKELEALDLSKVQPGDSVSPRNRVNFEKVREAAAHFKAKATELEQRAAALEQERDQLKTAGALPEDIQKELEDHRAFRKVFDAENDPDFVARFDGKIEAIDTDLLGYLKRNGLPEAVAEQIKAAGLGTVSSKWWQDNILSKLPELQRQRVIKYLTDREELVENKTKEAETFESRKGEYIQQQEERQKAEFATYRSKIDARAGELLKDVNWMKQREYPANATPEQKKAVDDHNAGIQEARQRFEQCLFPETPEFRAEVAIAAVASIKLAQDVNDLAQRLEARNKEFEGLKSELDAIKSKGRMPSGDADKRKKGDDTKDTSKLSDSEAIDAGLDAAMDALK